MVKQSIFSVTVFPGSLNTKIPPQELVETFEYLFADDRNDDWNDFTEVTVHFCIAGHE